MNPLFKFNPDASDPGFVDSRDFIREAVDHAAQQIARGVEDGIRQKLIDHGWTPPRGDALKAGAARELKDHEVREAVSELVRVAAAHRMNSTESLRDQIRAVVLPLVGKLPDPPTSTLVFEVRTKEPGKGRAYSVPLDSSGGWPLGLVDGRYELRMTGTRAVVVRVGDATGEFEG